MKNRLAIVGVFMKNERDEQTLYEILKEHHKYLINKTITYNISSIFFYIVYK